MDTSDLCAHGECTHKLPKEPRVIGRNWGDDLKFCSMHCQIKYWQEKQAETPTAIRA